MIKRILLFLSFILLTFFMVGCQAGPPVNVAGRWSGGYDITAVITPCTLQLEQDGTRISGTYDAFEAASQTALGGKVTGAVSGNSVTLELEIPEQVKEKRKWTSLTMNLVLNTEEKEPTLGGWTKRMEGEKKTVMESLFTRE
jgi:hypothetical protein